MILGVDLTARPIVIVSHQLGFGGATKAVLDQAAMFARAGREVLVATFDDSPTQSARVEELRASGSLPATVKLLNVHEEHCLKSEVLEAPGPLTGWLRGLRRRDHAASSELAVPEERLIESGRDSHGDYRREFDGSGSLLTFTRVNKDGAIKHVNHYRDAMRVRQDRYIDGFAHVRTVYNSNDAPTREMFLARNGFCYAQRWLSPETGRGVGVFVADRQSGQVVRHSGLPAWHVDWLQSIVDSFSTVPYVIAESSSAITKIMGLRSDSAVRMAMMHNSHLTAPFEVDSPLRADYEATFRRMSELDAFLVLSERQRSDMVDRIGCSDVMTVVPNVLRFPEVRRVERDVNLVSVVSRLAPQKALHEAIRAFAVVLEEAPDARLEIYGSGPSKQELESLVEELGLGSNVLFKGRTKEPLEVMARSLCTISTSEWEALPLSIAESLGVGTPVVAYDCLYGPSALIKDGETGFIVPRGSRSQLAGAILKLLKEPTLSERLGKAGRADVKGALDEEAVLSRWQDSFDWADQRFAARNLQD